ncbi:hypothetical protein MEO_05476 [Candida albicans P94015]|nr:hypothetical protein MEO_05476 [Candida albicans P94015]
MGGATTILGPHRRGGVFSFSFKTRPHPLLTPTLRYYHHHHHHHQYNLLAPYIIIVNINHFFF